MNGSTKTFVDHDGQKTANAVNLYDYRQVAGIQYMHSQNSGIATETTYEQFAFCLLFESEQNCPSLISVTITNQCYKVRVVIGFLFHNSP